MGIHWIVRFLAAIAIAPVGVAAAPATEMAGAGLAGEIEVLSLPSEVLDQDREVLVALPEGYGASTDSCPVLYVVDADWHFLAAVSAVRFLAETSYISAHRIPQMIVVGVGRVDRDHDYTPTLAPSQHGMSFPTSGGADQFLEFMDRELIPEIDARYRTRPYRVLAGWSLGGLLTMHALFERPDLFGGHLAISPSLWWDADLLVTRGAELASEGAVREKDLVLSIGGGEEGGLCYEAVHDLVDVWGEGALEGLSFSFIEIPEEDHNHSPAKAYLDGLRKLFADWFYPEEAFAEGLESLQAHYASLSARRGYAIPIPGHLYSALARTMLAEGKSEEAMAVMQDQCEQNPESALLYYELGEVCRQARSVQRAREAYLQALALERTSAEADTVFLNWVEGRIAELDGPE
jgi:predicted alpha/beta superfamily hydrolase